MQGLCYIIFLYFANFYIGMTFDTYNIWRSLSSSGQKYIYTGSNDGSVFIYDVVCHLTFILSTSQFFE